MRTEDISICLFLFCQILDCVKGQLLADRSVSCQSDEMQVTLEFQQPFSGVVYADKYFQSRECHFEGDGSRSLLVPVSLNTNPATQPYCGVNLKESSGEFMITLIISPVKNLLVEGMEKLTVRCLYTIGDVTLTLPAGANGAGIFISPQTQGSVVTGSGGSPFLQMTIREGHGINGEIIQSAQVGQRITLDVIMQDTTIYDFWVHDCYAHDGTNSPEASISILDSNGCVVRLARAVDPPVFETSPTPNGAKHVYVHMYGFQFTTSQLVYFECQVRPCLQSCNRPQCTSAAADGTSRQRRQLQSRENSLLPFGGDLRESTQEEENYNLTAVIKIEPQELESFTPVARDDPGIFKADVGPQLCIHSNVAIAILVIFVVVCLVSLFIAVYLCHRARKDTRKPRVIPYGNPTTPTSTAGRRTTLSYSSPQSPFRVMERSAHSSPRDPSTSY